MELSGGSGFSFEGYTCVFKGNGEVSSREEFLLREGSVKGLVPVVLYRENRDWVFVYDLDGGYSLGEILNRGEGLIGVSWFISLLELVGFCVSEFFFDVGGFFVVEDGIIMDFDDLSNIQLIYCPLYRGDFWGSFFYLFGCCFRDEVWFSSYLSGLDRFGGCYGIASVVSYLRGFVHCGSGVDDEGGLVVLDGEDGLGGGSKGRKGFLDVGYGFVLSYLEGASIRSLGLVVLVVFLVGVVFGFFV